ncbi:TniQ family protein [Streptomyces niveus]
MTTSLDTIPIRVAPLPGEALDSWLDAYAHRLQAQTTEILALAGLHPSKRTARSTVFGRKPWVPELHPADFTALSAVTGIPVEGLGAMTLSRYAGSLIIFDTQANRLDRIRSPWSHRTQASRFCPECLGDTGGRWKLNWRLPWLFACVDHRCLLVDACPACNQHARVGWSRRGRPSPGFCRAPLMKAGETDGTRLTARCLQPLREAESFHLPRTGPVLVAQSHLDTILNGILDARDGDPASLPRQLGELRDLDACARTALSALFLTPRFPSAVAGVLNELGVTPEELQPGNRDQGGSVVTMAPASAFALTVALRMLRNRDVRLDSDITEWLLASTRNGAKEPYPSAIFASHRWGKATPELQSALLKEFAPRLQASDQLRYATSTAMPGRPAPGRGQARAHMLPAFFWRGLALRLTPGTTFSLAPTSYRAALGAMTLMVGDSTLTYQQARDLLFPDHQLGILFTRAGAATLKLRKAGALAPVLSAVSAIARRLDEQGSPIDYARRRLKFSYADLDERAYIKFCDDAGLRMPSTAQRRWVRYRLIEMLTGTHPYYPPGQPPLTDSSEKSAYEEWALRMSAPLSQHVFEQAHQLLDAADIDEPVQWEPPVDWLNGIALPGPDPNGLDIERIWRLVRRSESVTLIAGTLGTTSEHIRTAVERQPVPPRSGGRSRARNAKIPRTRLPNGQDLKSDLASGTSQRDIAQTAGCSRTTIRRLLTREGVPAQPSGRKFTYTIDPAWLRNEYEVRQRSFRSIAQEIGMSGPALRRRAESYGITFREKRTTGHPLGRYGSPSDFPPSIWKALTGVQAELRVERFIAALEHRSIREAARTMRITSSTLSMQIGCLEEATGKQLLQRDHGRRALRLTEEGDEFAREARDALAFLAERTGS